MVYAVASGDFTPGTLTRWGMAPHTLRARPTSKPRLDYCALCSSTPWWRMRGREKFSTNCAGNCPLIAGVMIWRQACVMQWALEFLVISDTMVYSLSCTDFRVFDVYYRSICRLQVNINSTQIVTWPWKLKVVTIRLAICHFLLVVHCPYFIRTEPLFPTVFKIFGSSLQCFI